MVDKRTDEPQSLLGDPADQIVIGFKPELGVMDSDRKHSLIETALAQLSKEFGTLLLPEPLVAEAPDKPEAFFAITLLRLNPGKTLAELSAKIGKGPYEAIGWAERNATIAPDGFSDPLASQQWALGTMGVTGPWTVSPPAGSSTILGVVDSGLRLPSGGLHPDLGLVEPVAVSQPPVMFPDCIDRVGHGTLLAGTMAARPNGQGIASPIDPSWNISLLPVQFFDPVMDPNAALGAFGITWAAANSFHPKYRARIIIAAWHVPPDAGLTTLKAALAFAKVLDCLIVFAAGNDGTNNEDYPIYPANLANDPALAGNVLVAAASDRYDGKTFFSNYGPNTVHIAAPGIHILTTAMYLYGDPRYLEYSGTSAAAAYVSAGAALVFALNPTWASQDVVQHLLASAVVRDTLLLTCIDGKRLDLASAVYGPLKTTAPAAGASLPIGQPANIAWTVEYDNPKLTQVNITFTDQSTMQEYAVATVGINTSPYVWTPTTPPLPPPPVTGWLTITPTTGNFPVKIDTVTIVP